VELKETTVGAKGAFQDSASGFHRAIQPIAEPMPMPPFHFPWNGYYSPSFSFALAVEFLR
jgi:hypothetical protein